MTENEWWLPSKLKEVERQAQATNDFNDLETSGDFGSYRRLVLGDSLENSNVSVHNDLIPRSKVQVIKKYLPLGDPLTILDAGCGLGFTTAVLAEFFPKSQVLGIDLAEDAIQYAKKTHKKASFAAITLDPEGERIGIFDVIFCFEIYPFSRNRNSVYQANLLNNLASNLSSGGKIIISQTWRNVDALPPVLEEVKQLCDGLQFKVIPYPHQRIPIWLPKTIALLLAKIGEFLTKKELVKKLILVTAK